MGNLTVKTGNIAGNLTKFFQTSQMHQDLPGGMGGFGFGRYIIEKYVLLLFFIFLVCSIAVIVAVVFRFFI